MLCYIFAKTEVPYGHVRNAVFNLPDDADKETQKQLIRRFCHARQLFSQQAKYGWLVLAMNNDPTVVVLSTERAVVNLDGSAVQAGQSGPRGQKGQERPAGPVSQGGFQELGDTDMPSGNDDSFFGGGDMTDAAYMDMVQDGGGFKETLRPASGFPPAEQQQ